MAKAKESSWRLCLAWFSDDSVTKCTLSLSAVPASTTTFWKSGESEPTMPTSCVVTPLPPLG